MSAEILRRAAVLMRERAEAATPGPWEASVGDSGLSYRALNASVITETMGDRVADCDYDGYAEGPHGEEGADAYFIASWHPAVALAVADWLESEAQAKESADAWDAEIERDGLDWARERANFEVSVQALAVARAYLGDER